MSNLKYYTFFLFHIIHSFSDSGTWLWSVFGWLIFASFIAKAKAMSYFSIFKFSMLAPYKGCGKRKEKKNPITRLCIITWSSITTWQSHLLAQLWFTYRPLSLRTNDRQAPLLRVIPSDRLNQSVFGLGLGCHQTGWSFDLRILGTSEKTPERSWEGSDRNTLLKNGLVTDN